MNSVVIKVDAGGYYPYDVGTKQSVSGERRFGSREQAIVWVQDRYPCDILNQK